MIHLVPLLLENSIQWDVAGGCRKTSFCWRIHRGAFHLMKYSLSFGSIVFVFVRIMIMHMHTSSSWIRGKNSLS